MDRQHFLNLGPHLRFRHAREGGPDGLVRNDGPPGSLHLLQLSHRDLIDVRSRKIICGRRVATGDITRLHIRKHHVIGSCSVVCRPDHDLRLGIKPVQHIAHVERGRFPRRQ